jgi:hypothetical protein
MVRPMMIIGQDESVFAQYLLGAKTWVGPKGQRPLVQRAEGDGYMFYAFVSRGFGFGRLLTEDELAKITSKRQTNGATYDDTQHTAMEVLVTITKLPFTESPFGTYIFIGAINEGYWNSRYMSLQFGDFVNCLHVLYPVFDLAFLFDHSKGHGRQQDNALSAQHMSKPYGQAQPMMRETTELAEEGFLDPHLPELRVTDTQSMIFLANKSGPCYYLTPDQRALQRHNNPTERPNLLINPRSCLTRR